MSYFSDQARPSDLLTNWKQLSHEPIPTEIKCLSYTIITPPILLHKFNSFCNQLGRFCIFCFCIFSCGVYFYGTKVAFFCRNLFTFILHGGLNFPPWRWKNYYAYYRKIKDIYNSYRGKWVTKQSNLYKGVPEKIWATTKVANFSFLLEQKRSWKQEQCTLKFVFSRLSNFEILSSYFFKKKCSWYQDESTLKFVFQEKTILKKRWW